jgi:Secretion system C-terminal sorting domain
MKNLILSGLLLMLNLQLSAQTLNCSSICVTNVSFNNLTGLIDVTIVNADTNQINYPIIQLIDVNGDTIGNPTGQFFLFAQLPGQLVTHEVPATVPSLPFGFFGTVILTDPVFNNTCSFTYPSTCFTGNPWPDCNDMTVENLNLDPVAGTLDVTLFNNCLSCASGTSGPVYCEMTVIHNVAPFDTIANSACFCFQTPNNLSSAVYTLPTTVSNLPPSSEIMVLMYCGSGGCDTLLNNPQLSIAEGSVSIEFLIFPNPASETVTVAFKAIQSDNTTIKIIDIKGRVVAVEKYNGNNGLNLKKIDVSELAPGSYVISVTNELYHHHTKLVVQ